VDERAGAPALLTKNICMLLTLEQLLDADLTGIKFGESYRGYTMTARNGEITDYYAVLKDDGDAVTVIDLNSKSKKVLTRDQVCKKISACTCYKMVDGEMVNEIVNI
jgi:hypothetical protein